MRDAFARGVGMPRPQDHRDGTEQIRHRGDKTGLRVGEAERLDDLRKPELHAIERADESEIDQAQRDHFWRSQRLPEREMRCGPGVLFVTIIHCRHFWYRPVSASSQRWPQASFSN